VVSFTPGRFNPRERAPGTHWIEEFPQLSTLQPPPPPTLYSRILVLVRVSFHIFRRKLGCGPHIHYSLAAYWFCVSICKSGYSTFKLSNALKYPLIMKNLFSLQQTVRHRALICLFSHHDSVCSPRSMIFFFPPLSFCYNIVDTWNRNVEKSARRAVPNNLTGSATWDENKIKICVCICPETSRSHN
jgi:hypothetical protein